jgi:hypothetical protein
MPKLRIAAASVLFIPAVLFAPAAAHAGYRFVGDDGMETVISEGRMRVSIPAVGYMRGYDGARGRLWMANTKTRTFWQGTAEEYCQDAKRTRDAMMERQAANLSPEQRRLMEQYKKNESANREATRERQMENIPPAQRGMVEQYTKPPAPSSVKVTIERTEERTTIAGQPVRKVRVLADGQLMEELWLATDPAFSRSIDYAKVREIDRRVQQCTSGELLDRGDRDLENMPEMYRRAVDPGGHRAKQRLTRAVQASPEYAGLMREGVPLPPKLNTLEQRDIPAAEFEPPSGYRAVAPDEVMGAPR